MVVAQARDLFCSDGRGLCHSTGYLYIDNLIYHLVFPKFIHSATFQILSFLSISIEKK